MCKNSNQYNVWKQAVSVVAVAVVATGLVAPQVFADDTTYTVNQPPKSIVFNRITDNKDWGDERDFVLVKDVTDKYKGYSSIAELAKDKEGFSKEAELHEGHLYMVKTLVHNDADKSLNLVAKNTKVNTEVTPLNEASSSFKLKTTISADNCGATSDNAGSKCAVPGVVTLKRKDGDTSTYEVQNAEDWLYHTLYFNSERGLGTNGFMLNETDIANDKVGVLIGAKQLDGNMVGADAGYVISFIHVESTQPSFTLYNNARVVDPNVANKDRAMPTIVRANPGDTVEYKVEYMPKPSNKDVKLRSYLFPGAEYVSGSAKWVEGYGKDAKLKTMISDKWIMESDSTADEALSIGDSVDKNQINNTITYLVKVPEKDKLACGVNRLENVALVTAKVNGEDVKRVASSTIVVEGDKCPGSGAANTNSNDNSPEGPNDDHNVDKEHSHGNQGGVAQSDVCPSNHRIKAGDKRCVGAPRAGVKIATATVSLLSFLGLASFIVYRLMKANNKARNIEKTDN